MKRSRIAFFTAVAFSAPLAAFAQASGLNQICTVFRSTEKPVIDGEKDACYARAYPIDGFCVPRTLTPAEERTVVKMVHDGEFLYAHITCFQKDMASMKKWSTKRDDSRIWAGDAVEFVFLAADGRKHFMISPDGGIYDASALQDDANAWQTDEKWDGGMQLATARDDKSWRLEFAMPLKSIPGKRLRLNIARDFADGRKSSAGSRRRQRSA